MINHVWADVVPHDSAITKGEWAGVRLSTARERALINVPRGDDCSTFLFASCGGFVRLIITLGLSKPSFSQRLSMSGTIRKALAGKTHTVAEPFSCSVLGAAVKLVPAVIDELRAVASRRRCEGCTCMFRAGGPIDPENEQWKAIAAEIERGKARTAA